MKTTFKTLTILMALSSIYAIYIGKTFHIISLLLYIALYFLMGLVFKTKQQ